ncbi:hypothetical protein SLITO_v1c03340 [Spiroplasma litorale]|uniref:YlxR domain-containing protein n=1 Tax=Spiroplasma litorale TaxID=216942 RepID=A0A0K1W1D9_9MOLU|nr:YlxR family protein [Spiroplasma litorale]AKX33988.1 hypothetical protein SLITO_v1c03340 [Spiroplasma litorale]
MIKKKEVLRKDIATGKMFPRNFLTRIVKNKKGEISVDLSYKAHGKGVYILLNEVSIKKLIQKSLLDRAYRTSINKNVYQKIEEELLALLKNE